MKLEHRRRTLSPTRSLAVTLMAGHAAALFFFIPAGAPATGAEAGAGASAIIMPPSAERVPAPCFVVIMVALFVGVVASTPKNADGATVARPARSRSFFDIILLVLR